jgi:membrane associated rhomboid family serine protease
VVHLASNVVIGGTFFLILSRLLGSGAAWLLSLGAGALGNYLNSMAQGWGHRSLGASTAVFGAVGVLAGLHALRGQRLSFRKVFLPVAAGLTLLGFLGTAGERTDLGAHLFGFLVGLPLGAAAGLFVNRVGLPGVWANRAMALAAGVAVAAAWWMALHPR